MFLLSECTTRCTEYSSETNTSPTARIRGVKAFEAKVAELEAKDASRNEENAMLEAKIAELVGKDTLRNEENAKLRQENPRLKATNDM